MIIYRVVKGDTLNSISERYGIDITLLSELNSIDINSPLVVGQELVIRYPNELYTVKRGNSLYDIAENKGATVKQLLRNNPILNGIPTIYPDQMLITSYSDDGGRNIIVNGYAYPFITDENLRRILPYLTYLTVFSYGITSQGDLIQADDERILNIASSYDVGTILLISTLTEDGNFNNELSSLIFDNIDIQDNLIRQLVYTAKTKGYSGIEVDFEYIHYEDREKYVQFLQRLSEEMSSEGLLLFVALAPKTSDNQEGLLYEGHDYSRIGEVADYVILMTYEWGYQYGPPGAVAPINNVEAVVRYAVTEIPSDKILLGIPNYGYDWQLPYIPGETMAQGISNVGAVELAGDVGAEINFSEIDRTPNFSYNSDGSEHIVWFENAQSIADKAELVNKYDLAGISIWNVMKYFPQLNTVINSMYTIN